MGSLEVIRRHHKKLHQAENFGSEQVMGAALAIAAKHYNAAVLIQKVVRGKLGRAIAFGQVCVYDMDSEGYVVWYDDCSRCYRAGVQPVVLLPPYIEQ